MTSVVPIRAGEVVGLQPLLHTVLCRSLLASRFLICSLFYPVRMSPQYPRFQQMDPTLITPPELQKILAELSAREPIFHRPEFGTTRADFDKLMADDYWETGASGRRYSRAAILDELDRRFSAPHEDIWETSGFHCRQLSPDTYLLTYTLLQDNVRLTRRATIWQRTPDGWKLVYHQGTVVADPKAGPELP